MNTEEKIVIGFIGFCELTALTILILMIVRYLCR